MSNQRVSDIVVVKSLPKRIRKGAVYSISQPNPNTYTHSFFKYPCRFIPEIPRWAIKKYSKNKNEIIFDPFAGSGTTLLEAIILGHNAYGTEIDNIAKLLIKVKTTRMTNHQLEQIEKEYEKIIDSIKKKDSLIIKPKINNLNHWFTEENIAQLGRILLTINSISDKTIRDFFKVCFVSILKKVSKADDISPKPYVSKNIKKSPSMAIKEFAVIYKKYYDAITSFSNHKSLNKEACIIEGDALTFEFSKKIDLAITSPPYINAFDYARTLRLENLWLGTLSEEELREKKKKYVGTESIKVSDEEKNLTILEDSSLLKGYYNKIYKLDKKRALIVKKFFDNMKKNLKEIYEKLITEGYYIIVIGNSNIRGTEIKSWKVIEEIANKLGYKTETHFGYKIQNPYIRIPRGKKGGQINIDNVIVLKKTGGTESGAKK